MSASGPLVDIVTINFSRLEHSGSVDRVLGRGSKDSSVTVFNTVCCVHEQDTLSAA